MLPSVVQRFATDLPVRVFPSVWKLLSFLRLPSWDGAPSLPLLSLFIFLYFCLPPFEDNGLLFWVPVANIRWIMEKRREFQKNIRYVDDTTLMEESEEEIKSLLMKV